MASGISILGLRRATDRCREPEGARRVKVLQLKICNAVNLAKKDIFGASDPYVVISVKTGADDLRNVRKTTVKKKTLNPVWNEEFEINVNPD